MTDTDILAEKLKVLLEGENYPEALELIQKWENNQKVSHTLLSGEILLSFAKTYYFNRLYNKSREYISKYELKHEGQYKELNYIEQKYKLLILENKIGNAIELIETAICDYRTEQENFALIKYLVLPTSGTVITLNPANLFRSATDTTLCIRIFICWGLPFI